MEIVHSVGLSSSVDHAGRPVGPGHDPAVSLHVEVLLVRQDRVAPEVKHLAPKRWMMKERSAGGGSGRARFGRAERGGEETVQLVL